jgi:general secretion pathway protein A
MDFNAHFGFRNLPFTREIAVSDMFTHPQHDEILACLVRAVHHRMSAGLQAPAGYGKTSMIRSLCESLSDVRYNVHYVKITGLSKRDMCREIAKSLGLTEAGTYPRLLRLVQEAVETRSLTDGVRTVMILDDAHELRPDVLGMFKALTNFDMDSKLVLSIVLVGQPPLAKLLRRADLVDVAQRLSWYGELRALSRDETRAYVVHGCQIAGTTRELFDSRAQEALYEMGRGNPRATGHLARRALEVEVAHAADQQTVSAKHVISARGTLRL